ncbi:MAG TPA: hypothetical protein DC049_03370 [Spirochaetia bacterium]|nr:hypothetical protein [Spirochaetia bacterium]
MPIQLPSSVFESGKITGRYTGDVLKQRIAAVRKIQQEKKIPDSILNARGSDFKNNCFKICPKWLEELQGVSAGSGTDINDLLMINSLPFGFYQAGGNNCTTFVSIGKAENRLFKIRDECNHIQTFIIKNNNESLCQAGYDIGNMGFAHFFNSRGLAGANNTGSCTEKISDQAVLNDCHILRFIAENAGTTDEIPALLEKLLEMKLVGGAGKNRGSIFIFADQKKGLILECQSFDYTARFVEQGTVVVANHFLSEKARAWESSPPDVNTLTRKQRMEELLSAHGHNPSLSAIFKIARDRKNIPQALCNDDRQHFWMTISAQLHCIDKTDFRKSKNYFCVGNTLHSLFLPVPVDHNQNYLPFINGEFYSAANRIYEKYYCSDHMSAIQENFEKNIFTRQDYETIYADALATIKQT